MKIQFIGPYLQNDGWGIAALNFLKVLSLIDGPGTEIGNCPIMLSSNISQDAEETREQFPDIYVESPDIVISYALPPFFENTKYDKPAKNIGIFHTETRHLEKIGWIQHCNDNLDGVIVFTYQEQDNLEKSGLNVPIYVMPMPIDTTEIKNHLTAMDYSNKLKADPYTFYFIGENNERKNIKSLVRSYSTEFDAHENVKLVIRSNVQLQDIDRVQQSVRKEKYPPIELHGNHQSRDQLIDLHAASDCFVSASYGESSCIPLIEALIVGNSAIVTSGTGMDEPYSNRLQLTSAFEVPCECYRPPIHNIYTPYESWMKIDERDLMDRMRYDFSIQGYSRSEGCNPIHEHHFENVKGKLCSIMQIVADAPIASL